MFKGGSEGCVTAKNEEAKKVRIRMSLTEIFYNFCIASSNYRTVFLQSVGMGAEGIGLIASLSSVAGIVAAPVCGILSDRLRSVRQCFMVCLGLSALLMLALPFIPAGQTGGMIAIAVLLVLSSLFTGPANNMMENWLVCTENRWPSVSYGSMRVWASGAFAVMGLLYVPLLARIPVSSVYGFYFIFAVPALLLALRAPSEGEAVRRERTRLRDMPFRQLLRARLVLYIVFVMLFTVPSNWKVTYFVYVLNRCGYDSSTFGLYMFISAGCEIPALLLSRRVIRRFGPLKPMLVCYGMLVAESLLYVSAGSLLPVILGQVLKGLSSGMVYACQIRYIYRLAPKGLETTAHTLMNTAGSAVVILSSALGGVLLVRLGTDLFFRIVAALEIAAVLLFLMCLLIYRLRKKRPEGSGRKA